MRTAAEPWTLGAAYERCRQLHARHGRTYYLPAADLERFGVRRADLAAAPATPAVAELLAFEVTRARAHYAAARAERRVSVTTPGAR